MCLNQVIQALLTHHKCWNFKEQIMSCKSSVWSSSFACLIAPLPPCNTINHHTLITISYAVSKVSIKMAGSVMGHEQQIMRCLDGMLQRHVTLDILPEGSHEPAAATVLIRRMKPRLPSDEIQALLMSVQGI